jgi:hypothetical protein
MKLKTFKVKVALEFESIQPSTVDEAQLKLGFAEGIKQAVPKGCKVSEVTVKQINEFEKDPKELMQDVAKEVREFKEQERNNLVEEIATKKFSKTYGKSEAKEG